MATNTSTVPSATDRYQSHFDRIYNRPIFRSPTTGRLGDQQRDEFLDPSTGDPESDSTLENVYDQMMRHAATLTGSPVHPRSLNTRPTAAEVGERSNSLRDLLYGESRPSFLRNIRFPTENPTPIAPALETLPRVEGTLTNVAGNVGDTGLQVGEWASVVGGTVSANTIRASPYLNTNNYDSVNFPSTISGTLIKDGTPPDFVMSPTMEKAFLQLVKEKLSLKVDTQWEGKNIAVKVSLRVTETDEELISDSDSIQIDDSY